MLAIDGDIFKRDIEMCDFSCIKYIEMYELHAANNSEFTGDEKIEMVAKRVTERFRPVFQELAK